MADANLIFERLNKLAGDGLRIAAGTTDLTNAVAENIATGLTKVKFVIAATNANAATPGVVAGKIAAADDGTIDLVATGATGTTTVNWWAIGTRA